MSFSFYLKVFSDRLLTLFSGTQSSCKYTYAVFFELNTEINSVPNWQSMEAVWQWYNNSRGKRAAVFYCDVFVYIKYYKNKFNWQ